MLESKMRATIFLLLAFVLAAIAGYLVYDKVRTLNAELGGMTKIYVAAGSIPSRTLITEGQIKTMEIPNRYVLDSYITDKKKLINMVTVVPLEEDDIITGNMLKPATELREANHRLVAMYRSDKVQFDQVVTTNDRVDIIISKEENGEKKTELFMKDVPVAWAQGKGKDFVGVALEVPLDDAPKLINIQNYADHIRVLKANVGKEETQIESQPTETEQQQTQGQEIQAGTEPNGTEQQLNENPAQQENP